MAEVDMSTVAAVRVLRIVDDAGGRITAAGLCREMIARGWATSDLTPADIGMEDEDVIQRPCHA